jgi:superfamily II DNA/RNA helicase
MTTLQMQVSKTIFFRCSNDRPNVHITVRKILHPLNSFCDLKFVLQNWKPGDEPPPKFIIFCDSIRETVSIGKYLRKQLPPEYREKVKWFHANMSKTFCEMEVQAIRDGQTWGLCCTDSFSMVSNELLINIGSLQMKSQGIDLPDIRIVIQWCVRCGMCTLWQRFGRGARSPAIATVAILFAEAQYYDDEKEKARKAKAKRTEGKKGLL